MLRLCYICQKEIKRKPYKNKKIRQTCGSKECIHKIRSNSAREQLLKYGSPASKLEIQDKIRKSVQRYFQDNKNRLKTSIATKRGMTKEVCNKVRIARLRQILPTKDTKIERLLQNRLTVAGIQYSKHKRLIGQPDIFIEPNICIFCDGDYWHANPSKYQATDIIINHITASQVWAKDKNVTKKLIKQGYRVLRFWEHDINNNIENCYETIKHLSSK
jgi:DNA mismatch endonuclease (patch repair protein)